MSKLSFLDSSSPHIESLESEFERYRTMNDQRLSNLEQWRRSSVGDFGSASQASGSIHPGLMHNTGAMQLGVIPYQAEMGDMGPPSNNKSGRNPDTMQMGYDPMFGYQPRSGSANPGMQEGTSVVSPVAQMGPGSGGLSTGSANVRGGIGWKLTPQADTCECSEINSNSQTLRKTTTNGQP